MPIRARPLLLLLSLAATGACADAQAQIRRCNGPDGKSIFTDRKCNDVGATDSLPRAAGTAPAIGGKAYARGCSRNIRDLIFELTAAIDSRDTNRLAGLYNWSGMSNSGGYAVLSRLDAMANRPLVDISPVLPSPQLSLDADGHATVTGDVDPGIAGATVRRTPVGLRVAQTLSNGSSVANTVFGLRKYMGCWWLVL